MDAITLSAMTTRLWNNCSRLRRPASRPSRSVRSSIASSRSSRCTPPSRALFYPVTLATTTTRRRPRLESLEEHHVVKWLLDELEQMDPAHERFKAKVTVLIENVRHHVEEEEGDSSRSVPPRSQPGRARRGMARPVRSGPSTPVPTHRQHPQSARWPAWSTGRQHQQHTQGGVTTVQDLARSRGPSRRSHRPFVRHRNQAKNVRRAASMPLTA
jgi:hypothetical protein